MLATIQLIVAQFLIFLTQDMVFLVVFKAYNYIIQLYLYGDGIKQRKSQYRC